MTTSLPTEPAVEAAARLGHTVEYDPPAGMTAARRWTCTSCGDAALDYPGQRLWQRHRAPVPDWHSSGTTKQGVKRWQPTMTA